MIAISRTHRRLAELTNYRLEQNGDLAMTREERLELVTLLKENLRLVRKMDELKNLSQLAYEAGDTEWHMDICKQIEDLEATLI
ncbi:hypothetical protein [Paenibacillus sp. P22]|uniref:DUF7667 family protein n=1 Tax=Paenibacillus sp. P22 TaxID=483908 RepID=UPI00038FECC8|nr:hypothetical protein [Paenibacillus sp. P22]CDN41692.1 Uncharacterized protein BN871_AJ_00440 [Paenibacillus sp. P22]